MKKLLVGFDSAWTQKNFGALVGVIQYPNCALEELGSPQIVNFSQAENAILGWQESKKPTSTIVLIDQPTIVRNAQGQRPVENIVASPVGRRRGGMQPANTGKTGMFDCGAPIWGFLNTFGGPSNPYTLISGTSVFETYPVLAIIALGWILPDKRPTGRLPKYNPERKKTFSIDDWQFICDKLLNEFAKRNLSRLSTWIESKKRQRPKKKDQDCLDSMICLFCAIYFSELKECLIVGNLNTGYILVPAGNELSKELEARCEKVGLIPSDWVRSCVLKTSV